MSHKIYSNGKLSPLLTHMMRPKVEAFSEAGTFTLSAWNRLENAQRDLDELKGKTMSEQTRAAFEAHMKRTQSGLPDAGYFDSLADFWFERDQNGRYRLGRMEDAWFGWQGAVACIATAQAQ